jgi:beta-glucosidase/6-phospho-beta-glucosidase/beta-galactosidase
MEEKCTMAFSENFLWGGALAAHQFEGGLEGTSKGLSVPADFHCVEQNFPAGG